MKDIFIKIIVIVVAVMIILTAFNFIKQLEIDETFQEIKEKPLTVRILSDATTGTNPITIKFDSLVLNEKGDVKYFWDFGDEKTSEEENPSNLYEKGGNYICKLVVTDKKGNTAENTLNITIANNKPPVVILTLNKNTHERKFVPLLSILPLWPGDVQKIINVIEKKNPNAFGEGSVICTAQVSDPENDEIVSYKWVHQAETQLSQFGKPEQPTHNFSDTDSIILPEIYTWPRGRHVITLTVEDSIGNQANASIEFQVEESLKKIGRDQLRRVFTSLKNQWLLTLNPFLGPIIAALFLSMWKYNNFEGIKLITLFLLKFVFQLDMDDAFMTQLKSFLENHPNVLKIMDTLLIKMQKIFKNQDIEAIRESLGLANNRPKIFNPFPEDGAKNIPVGVPYVAINVSDLEGDPFNVTISGKYINGTNVTYFNVTNNTFIAPLITPLPEREEIFWNVEVVDPRGKIVTGEYKFTTFVEI